MKGYTVFNCEQVDGLPAHFYSKPAAPLPVSARIASADRFFAATGVALRHGGARAYYSQASDHVQMPPFESFRDAESYYTTLLHESTHATKHPKRPSREFGRKRWGGAGYAAKELVAELGAGKIHTLRCWTRGAVRTQRHKSIRNAKSLKSWRERRDSNPRPPA